MTRRIGILTSGGDCPGLNAAIRGVARAAYAMFDAEIVGIQDGYRGLIEGEWREMRRDEFSGILTLGGTILGTSRQPFRTMRVIGEDNVDKVKSMKKNYERMKLDCLVTLGGNGTHKTANLLSEEGLNVVSLPKTIDNDIWLTDVTFGFHTAVDIATDVIDRLHTTAASHGRTMVVEIMGNKAGWLTLYAGLAGGAAVAGCCAQMVGFAVLSFRENRWGGLVSQGLGTSMLQMGNIVKNPRIWLPAILTSAITGPMATCLFHLEMNGAPVSSGMGTCGLVGPIGVAAAPGFGSPMSWVSLILVCFVLPAILTPLIAWPMRRAGWIKDGDCKLDL